MNASEAVRRKAHERLASYQRGRVDWALTPAGEELLPVFHALMVWGARHERLAPEPAARGGGDGGG